MLAVVHFPRLQRRLELCAVSLALLSASTSPQFCSSVFTVSVPGTLRPFVTTSLPCRWACRSPCHSESCHGVFWSWGMQHGALLSLFLWVPGSNFTESRMVLPSCGNSHPPDLGAQGGPIIPGLCVRESG